MTPEQFSAITGRYCALRVAVIGDFCLDRYFEIDPRRGEVSIETGRAVHNVVRVRNQPGAAGTITANLAALGIGRIDAVGFCGEDGEGFELRRGLASVAGLDLTHFFSASDRRTFTYLKPLVCRPDAPPEELDRLDLKNWALTCTDHSARLAESVRTVGASVDAVIVMDQVSESGTGVVTPHILDALRDLARRRPDLPILADSRRTLRGYPPLTLKMNASEFLAMTGLHPAPESVRALAQNHQRPVFVTLAERGILGAAPEAWPGWTGTDVFAPSRPVRGPIDVVGAGDAVTANLAAALAAGANGAAACQLAMAAASEVIHQLGATGVATVADLRRAF